MEAFEAIPCAVATTGTFDGFHAGHRLILDRMKDIAKGMGGETVLITFDPHPRKVIHPEFPLALLTTLDERAELLSEAGLDHLIVQPFTPEFSSTSSLDFVRKGLVGQVGVKKLVIGYDHHFGRNREGTFAHLQEFGPVYGFEVEEIPPHEVEEVKVSSTKIRKALIAGEVEKAAVFLARPYFVSGTVVHGESRGTGLGYPTANVGQIDPDKLLPADGVYLVMAERLTPEHRGERWPALANLGMRPTVEGQKRSLEVHWLDFSGDLYGTALRVHFVQRVRDEQKFADVMALKAQIQRDEQTARAYFASATDSKSQR